MKLFATLLILLALIVAFAYFSIDRSIGYCILTLACILYEIYRLKRTERYKNSHRGELFKFGENIWTSVLVTTGFFVFVIFYKLEVNPITIINIPLVIILSFLLYRTQSLSEYLINEDGIYDVSARKFMPADIITSIEKSDKGIIIHTIQYRYDLELAFSQLKDKDENQLIHELEKINPVIRDNFPDEKCTS